MIMSAHTKAVITCFLIAASQPAAASPWLDLRMPEERQRSSERMRAVEMTPDLAPLSLREYPNDPLNAISGERIFQHLENVIALTREHRPPNEPYWGRIAGSKTEHETSRYLANKFRELGLTDVRLDEVKGGPQWIPKEWSVELIADPAYGEGTENYTLNSAFPALQLGDVGDSASHTEQVEAELVYVGFGQPADLVGRDITGKIAVVRAVMQPDSFFQTARGHIDALVEAGAVGVLTVLDSPGNHRYALEDMGPPDVPCFVLGGDDGRFLLDVIAGSNDLPPLRARLNLHTEIKPTWLGYNALGTVSGETDEYMIVMAHLDSYFEGANDNAAGIASLLTLAEYFADEATEKPQRNILFVGISGHHEFSDGVREFITAHSDELDRSVLVMNIEHPSSTYNYYRGELHFKRFTVPGQITTTTSQGTRSLNISNRNKALTDIYAAAIDRYSLVIDANLERRPPSGDAALLVNAGYTTVQILDSNIWYHSDADLTDTIKPAGLERATRVYAEVLRQADRLKRAAIVRKK